MQVLFEYYSVKVWLQRIDNERTRQACTQNLRRMSKVTGPTLVRMLDEVSRL